MQNDDQNPYQAPESDIQVTSESGELLAVANTVPIGRGFTWIEKSLGQTLKPNLGMWMLIGLIYGIISLVLSLIPLINIIVPYLLAPVFSAGLIMGAHHIFNGEKLELNHLFAGFQHPRSSQLFVFGAITIAIYFLIFIAIIAFIGFDFIGLALAGGEPDPEMIASMAGKFLILIPLGLVAGVIFLLALWFPPALIALHDVSAMDALKIGFKGAMKNLGAVIVFLLMFIVLAIVISILFAIVAALLGFISEMLIVLVALFAIPLALLAAGFWAGVTYHAYRDIFLAQD
ncbi:MAG: hypothetical protein HWE16_11120 [Gammaproteobacteria bacterium]|nr:hypothetical protein [Gammaproteobacteria bacterium]